MIYHIPRCFTLPLMLSFEYYFRTAEETKQILFLHLMLLAKFLASSSQGSL